jgi:hypothetical protein
MYKQKRGLIRGGMVNFVSGVKTGLSFMKSDVKTASKDLVGKKKKVRR